MLDWFREKSILTRAYYYTAVVEGEEFSPVKPLVDWLDYNGFTVVTKPVKRFTDAQGQSRIKGNMDIEIAVDMLELAPRLDHVVLFSGDGDFRRLVQAVQAQGVRVTVISTTRTQPPHIADELRRQLQDAGFQVASDSLEFSQRDPSSGGGAFDRQQRNALFAGGSRVAAQADLAAAPPVGAWTNRSLTPDRVDVRV